MIRNLTEQDRLQFIQMVDDFYHSPAVLHSIPREYIETTFQQIIEGSPYAKGYLFEHDGEAAGYTILALTYSNEVGGMVVWIEEVLILDQFRGKGLGSEFFTFLEKEFSDARRFRLEVTRENTRAVKLYEKLGYEALDYLQMTRDL